MLLREYEEPSFNDTRVVVRFLWWPTTRQAGIGRGGRTLYRTRWLERAKIKQEWYGGWRDRCWEDDA